MPKRLLDVGNCVPDHTSIRRMVANNFAGAEVAQAHGPEDTLELAKQSPFDLIVINRKLDRDYTDGLDIIKLLKADPATKDVPVMLITNYAEHQEAAVAAGAEYGFGKLELSTPETRAKLAKYLQ